MRVKSEISLNLTLLLSYVCAHNVYLYILSHVFSDVGILMIYSIKYNINDTMSSEMSEGDFIWRAIV